MTASTSTRARFVVLVYRVPPKPTANRVYVWRMLKKVGAVYLQQSVCVFPQNARVARDLQPILRKIEESAGEYHVLPLRRLPPDEERKLIAQFVEQTARHYAEIIENCEVDFVKEIEFETFRRNFTYEEAEEIRSEYEKVCAWFARVRERDWFGAPNQQDAKAWLDRCATLLDEFEGRVFELQAGESGSPVVPPARRRRRSAVLAPPAAAARPGDATAARHPLAPGTSRLGCG
jgi:Protein ChrB, N-terminal